jgi:uncharacterized repeat protein (TIGR04076 family)
MKRRDFMEHAGCGLATVLAASGIPAAAQTQGQTSGAKEPGIRPPTRFYRIDLEIFEARPDSWCHNKGETFRYPRDWGKICPWLRGSLNDFVRILESGATLAWRYEGTPYEKVIDPDGVTTEYVRCPDPTANLVVKIIRTRADRPVS